MSDVINMRDYVYAIAPSPDFAHDGICFVARETGLYRLDTATNAWHAAYEALRLPAALVTPAVALSPGFVVDQTLFAGTNGGVLRSEDGGRNWVLGNMPRPAPVVTALVLSPDFANDGVALAGTMEDGLLRSPDRGTQWHRWNFGLLDLHVLCLAVSPAFVADGTLWVGTDTGMFHSTNGGRSWRQTGFPGDRSPVLCIAHSPTNTDDGIMYAGTEANGLFITRDGGDRWVRMGDDVFPDVVSAVIVGSESAMAAPILATSDERVLISRDGGGTWDDVPCELSPDEAISAVATPEGLACDAHLLIGTSNGRVLQPRIV